MATMLPLYLTACGGGGGGSNTPTANAPAPVSGTDPATVSFVKVGPITGFGSVFVDGERFETSSTGTDYLKDDDVSGEDDMQIGMVVRVRATSKNSAGEWIADDVEFDEELKGPVDSIVDADTLVALGQTINVSDETYFDDGLTFADIDVNEIIEVSGYRNELDEIDATYIELKSLGDVDEYEVLGQVRDLDTDAKTFYIGKLKVFYAGAELDDLGAGLREDKLVEVEDETRAYMGGDMELFASKVEGEYRTEFKDEDDDDLDGDGISDSDDDSDSDLGEFEITSVVTEVIDDFTFMMGSIEVHHDSGTEFEGGTAAEIDRGVRLEVEGALSGDVMDADEIEFDSVEAEISGLISEVRESENEIVVMGVTVDLSGAELEDDRDGMEVLSIGDLERGDFVDVEGREGDLDVVSAFEVELDDADDDSEMRAVVDAYNETAGTVTLLGQLISSNEQTRFECGEEQPCTKEKFFSRLYEDQTVVEADWDGAQMDTSAPARELSLED